LQSNPYVAVASITELPTATVVRCFTAVSFAVSCFRHFVGGTIEIIELLVGFFGPFFYRILN